MKKHKGIIMTGIILLIISSGLFLINAKEKEKIRSSALLKSGDIAGFHLTSKTSGKMSCTERWETVTSEVSKERTKRQFKNGNKALTENDWYKSFRIKRIYYPTKTEAYNEIKKKKSCYAYKVKNKTYYGYEYKENSPSGKRYGDISKYLVARNIPGERFFYFAKDNVFIEIYGSGRNDLKRRPLSWEFIENLAGIVESRL